MCGIFGIVSIRGEELSSCLSFSSTNVVNVLRHRGPDDSGYFADSSVYLGHRRLSIIDLEAGRQPIFNEDDSKGIIFNGEIYNFKEIRERLISKGHLFRTNSDTEVILHGYEEWGVNCVHELRGMFAFAVWDRRERKLFVARDRLGIKPVFYAVVGDLLYFASEMKALLQFPWFPREISENGLAAYFTLAYVPAPMTIFKHIRKLPAGHTLCVENNEVRIQKYWDLQFEPDRSKTEGYFTEGILGLLQEAVTLRMISDVPVGAFLSGGIDSGTVVSLMARAGSEPVRTFSMGFGGNVGGYLDERKYAREIAARYGALHREFEVLPKVSDIIRDIVRAFDEPFADPTTIPSYYLCKMTRQNVKVALSGLGGDEVFGGYERYLGFRLSGLYRLLPEILREKLIRSVFEKIPERADGHYTVNHLKRFVRAVSLDADERYFGFLTMLGGRKIQILAQQERYDGNFDHCRELILGYFNADNAREPLDRVFYCDIKSYLAEDILACTDRISMQHSLEVRVPFLDHKLVEFSATIPSEMKVGLWKKKHVLRKAVGSMLPRSVMEHRKQGFIGPMAQWLRTDLKDYIQEILSPRKIKTQGILDAGGVQSIIKEHMDLKENHDKLIWALVVFQTWYEDYILTNQFLPSKGKELENPYN